MATVKLWTDAEAETHPKVKAVFDDIRATRKSDFVNNFWRGLANQPEILERTWNTLKAVMGAPGPLDPAHPGTDLHRRVDNERLLLLHPFAYGGGPREGDDRRAILRFSGSCGHGLADKCARDRPATARRRGLSQRELNTASEAPVPSGTPLANEKRPARNRFRAGLRSNGRRRVISPSRPCRVLSTRRPECRRAKRPSRPSRIARSPPSPRRLRAP